MYNLFIISFKDSNIYYITLSNHITKLRNMLNKYYIEEIDKYDNYQICKNFRELEIHENIIFLQNNNFIDYFNYFYKKYRIRNNFYKFEKNELNEIIIYLKKFKPIYNKKEVKEKELYKCVKCNKVLSSIIYFNRHIEKCKGLKCEICNRKFSTVQNLENHKLNCGKFKCDFCKCIFTSKFKYNKHINSCINKK